eukprot:SM000389S14637  [mRNA]  locus=s389:4447:13232:+ [translate_table: standard]
MHAPTPAPGGQPPAAPALALCSFSTGRLFPPPAAAPAALLKELETRWNMAQCHLAQKDVRAAIIEIVMPLVQLEGASGRRRTLQVSLALASLYMRAGLDRSAASNYKDCLRQNPYVLEAVPALASLGAAVRDLQAVLPQPSLFAEGHCAAATQDHAGTHPRVAPGGTCISPLPESLGDCCLCRRAHPRVGWSVHAAADMCKHSLVAAAAASWRELDELFPGNPHVLLHMARTHVAIGDLDAAMQAHHQCRQADPYCMAGADEYATLAAQRGDRRLVMGLTRALLDVDPTQPEAWVASAVFWRARQELDRALVYAHQAISQNDRHAPAHLIAGSIMLDMGQAEGAAAAFRRAQELRPEMRALGGLIRALLAAGNRREALAVARQAAKHLPQSAAAFTLVGDVYASHVDGHNKVERRPALLCLAGPVGCWRTEASLAGSPIMDALVHRSRSLIHEDRLPGLLQAKKAYETALQLDPKSLGAALSLADLLVARGNPLAAISLLKKLVERAGGDAAHEKLAGLLTATHQPDDAFHHLYTLLAKNRSSETARGELEQLEKLLKGQAAGPDSAMRIGEPATAAPGMQSRRGGYA